MKITVWMSEKTLWEFRSGEVLTGQFYRREPGKHVEAVQVQLSYDEYYQLKDTRQDHSDLSPSEVALMKAIHDEVTEEKIYQKLTEAEKSGMGDPIECLNRVDDYPYVHPLAEDSTIIASSDCDCGADHPCCIDEAWDEPMELPDELDAEIEAALDNGFDPKSWDCSLPDGAEWDVKYDFNGIYSPNFGNDPAGLFRKHARGVKAIADIVKAIPSDKHLGQVIRKIVNDDE